MPTTKINHVISDPSYYHREYSNDIPKPDPDKLESSSWIDQSKRIAFAALPFISLYKPLSFPLSLAMGGLRAITSITQLIDGIKQGEVKYIASACLNTAVSIIALVGTLFAHPLGMLISTGHDLLLATVRLIQSLHKSDYKGAAERCLEIINNALYLALFLHGGLEVSIMSLAMQIVIGIYHSQAEFRQGHYIEGLGHLLMSLVRGNQILRQVKILQIKLKIDAAIGNLKAKRETTSIKSVNAALNTSGSDTELLKLAQSSNNQELIDVLIKYGNKNGWTSLTHAVWAGDLRAVSILLNYGADPNLRSLSTIDRAGRGIDVISDGMSPLDAVFKTGNLEIAELLLKKGANPSILREVRFDQYQREEFHATIGAASPIYEALRWSKHELLELFLKYHADFNAICHKNTTQWGFDMGTKPLEIAIRRGDARLVEILLKGGAKF